MLPTAVARKIELSIFNTDLHKRVLDVDILIIALRKPVYDCFAQGAQAPSQSIELPLSWVR
jgi:hypothetical protein